MATPQLPLDEQGLSGFAMPNPYGLQDYCDSLLPDNPSNEDIYEALQLFKVPKEAYPNFLTKQLGVSWEVETQKQDLMGLPYKLCIHVFLRRHVFVSRPSQIWPKHPAFGKSYFSFFASYENEICPVVNPMPPGARDTGHR